LEYLSILFRTPGIFLRRKKELVAMFCKFASLPKFTLRLSPDVAVLRVKAFRRQLSHESSTCMNVLMTYERLEGVIHPSVPSAMCYHTVPSGGCSNRAPSWGQSAGHTRHHKCWHLNPRIPGPEL
jgi:hypothetical protein